MGESEDDRAQKLIGLDFFTHAPLLLAERPSAREISDLRQQPRRLKPERPRPEAMAVSLRHPESVAEDTAQLPPFAEVQQCPRPMELAHHVLIRVAHLQRQP